MRRGSASRSASIEETRADASSCWERSDSICARASGSERSTARASSREPRVRVASSCRPCARLPRSTTASGVRDSGMMEAALPRPEESAKTWSQALSRRVSAFSWAEA